MSLNQIFDQNIGSNQIESWKNLKCNSLTVNDLLVAGELGSVYEGTIDWSGPYAVTRGYKATVAGTTVILRLDQVLGTSTFSDSLIGNPDQQFLDNLLPDGAIKSAEMPCIVVEDGSDISGRIFLRNTNDIIVSPAYNKIASGIDDTTSITLYAGLQVSTNNVIRYRPFKNSGTVGWNRPIIMVYQLDQ